MTEEKMKIESLKIQEIFDSRGEPTIEVELTVPGNHSFLAKIPSGKSRGAHEAAVLSYTDAQKVLHDILRTRVVGLDFETVKELDTFLIKLDGTERKEKLGGNVMLGVSIAFARALAYEKGKELWEVLHDEFFPRTDISKRPLIFANLVNGGVHADNNLDIQEYMTVAEPKGGYRETVQKLISFYERLGFVIEEERDVKRLPLGDEEGYEVNFKDNFAPVAIMEKLIRESELQGEFRIALDVAASEFYKDGKYTFEGHSYSTDELVAAYGEYFKKSDLLCSLEDPCNEGDFEGFKKIMEIAGDRWIVADDLTTTDPRCIEKYAEEGLMTGVIIKANQIGTLTETCEAIHAAKRRGVRVIVSHRSGETDDPFLIHIAKASGADGVKIGAPAKERIVKYDELIRLYE